MAGAALPAVCVLWGFTVDDALISARVAENLVAGHGYRFNSGGPVTDAVTPLGFAHALALFAGEGSWQTLWWARVTGVLAWLAAAGLLGYRLRGVTGQAHVVALVSVAVCVPLGAWAVAGMETPWVTLLCVLALGHGRWSMLMAGLGAALRPELVPWAVAVALLGERARGGAETSGAPGRWLVALAAALGPALCVALVRLVAFGSPVPLAALAKPSDFSHGARYVGVALLLSGPPWLLVGFGAYRQLPARARVFGVAFLVHGASLVLAGGDWMSFFRLLVPVLPSVIYVGAELAARSPAYANAARLVLVVASSSVLWLMKAGEARGVAAAREALIRAARPVLADAGAVAAVDVGWVSAATAARVVDLAGVTDPVVAALRGGHTTRRVPSSLLVQRKVDTLVMLLERGESVREPWYESRFSYGVEHALAYEVRDLDFQPVALLPLAGTGKHYVVLRSRSE